ncbi:MAG: hypothetical protein AB7P01_14635 [Bacteroidia bacterium]
MRKHPLNHSQQPTPEAIKTSQYFIDYLTLLDKAGIPRKTALSSFRLLTREPSINQQSLPFIHPKISEQ